MLEAGLACMIAAIVGGGLKFIGIDIPLISSRRRQISLGLLGLVLTVISVQRTFFATQPNTGLTAAEKTTLTTELDSNNQKIDRLDRFISDSEKLTTKWQNVIDGQSQLLARSKEQYESGLLSPELVASNKAKMFNTRTTLIKLATRSKR